MTKTPKPFHIGTRVSYVTDQDLDPGLVAFASGRSKGELVVYVSWPEASDGVLDAYPISDLVHADDGSPLGEWVPIKMLQWLGINAIIRGEVSQ